MNSEYPKYLSSKPSGVDLYDGQSQDRLAYAIREHIVSIDSTTKENAQPIIPRIIGLEGAWGCGKSNVIKKMDDTMNKEYIFFTYDAWGYQEDLQRRSVLESLTEFLIAEQKRYGDIMNMSTKIRVLNGHSKLKDESCTWQDRLDTLAARKSQTKNVTMPSINNDTKWFVLFILISGMIPSLFNTLKFTIEGAEWLNYLFPGLCVLAEMILWAIFVVCVMKGFDRSRWKKMWAFYQSNTNSETTSFTISQEEPSGKEFREWMQDLNDSLVSKRLVVVFDNMDRLSAEKVKKLWSSIHTFFAEKSYDKIWCIVPFDKKHLAKAYGSSNKPEDTAADELCKAFVAKTFPVVYNVSEAVITDYRGVFGKFIKQAFDDLLSKDDIDFVNRVYRLSNPEPNARHMIAFVNELVTVYKRWNESIDIKNMVLYIINKDLINYKTLIDGDYKGTLGRYYVDDENTKTQISALHYGVDLTVAAQLPLKQYLQKILGSETISEDINQVIAKNQNFFTILDDEIHDMDCNEKMLTAIDKLCRIKESNPLLEADWNYLASEYIADDTYPLGAKREFKELAIHTSEGKVSDLIAAYLNRVKSQADKLKGNVIYSYYSFIKDLVETDLADVEYTVPETVISAEHFVEYLKEAKGEYKRFPVVCDKKELTEYANKQMDALNDISAELSYIASDEEYTLEGIYSHAVEKIESKDSSIEVYDVLFNYCIVSKGNGLIDADNSADAHMSSIYASMSSTPSKYKCFIDIYLILALHGNEANMPEDSILTTIDRHIWNYTSVDGLFKKMISKGTGTLNSIVKYCITNKIVKEGLVDNIVSNIEAIKQHTGNTYSEILEYIDACKYYSFGEADKAVVFSESLLSKACIAEIAKVNNKFCQLIITQLKGQMEQQKIDQFTSTTHIISRNSYWITVLDNLCKLEYYKKSNVPEIIVTICNNILLSISEGNLTVIGGDSLEEKILQVVPFSKVSTTVYNILSEFTSGKSAMNNFKFKVLHKWFEELKDIGAGPFLNRIINPIKADAECQNIIAANPTFYKPMINEHISEDSELFEYLKQVKAKKESATEKFEEFVGTLSDIVVEETE